MRLPMLPILLLATLLRGQEPLAIVVHPQSGVTQLTREEVVNLFLGRQKQLAPNLPAMPVEQVSPEDVVARFYRLLVGKDPAEINAYWARLLFSGQTQPPRRAKGSQEVLSLVAAHRGAIGFVERSRVDRRVRVVFVLGGTP